MSKRTIIFCIVAVVLLTGAFISLWFDYRSIISEAKAIIDNEEIEPENKPAKEVKGKTTKPEVNENGKDNGETFGDILDVEQKGK